MSTEITTSQTLTTLPLQTSVKIDLNQHDIINVGIQKRKDAIDKLINLIDESNKKCRNPHDHFVFKYLSVDFDRTIDIIFEELTDGIYSVFKNNTGYDLQVTTTAADRIKGQFNHPRTFLGSLNKLEFKIIGTREILEDGEIYEEDVLECSCYLHKSKFFNQVLEVVKPIHARYEEIFHKDLSLIDKNSLKHNLNTLINDMPVFKEKLNAFVSEKLLNGLNDWADLVQLVAIEASAGIPDYEGVKAEIEELHKLVDNM